MIDISEFTPYLGTGVKVQYTDYIEDETEGVIPVLKVRQLEIFNFLYSFHYDKLILRPLSDLTKEIEHNGERFVPIEWFEEKYYTLDLHKQCLRLLEEDGENWINQSDYMLVQKLIEWGFDVFGLIERDLAVDINTLNITQ